MDLGISDVDICIQAGEFLGSGANLKTIYLGSKINNVQTKAYERRAKKRVYSEGDSNGGRPKKMKNMVEIPSHLISASVKGDGFDSVDILETYAANSDELAVAGYQPRLGP